MPSATSRPLTDRQRDVLERIDRRVPIKVIAQELGVSETRINQHIRALKDIFGASSLNELVVKYRASMTVSEPEAEAEIEKALSEVAYIKKQLQDLPERVDLESRVDEGELVMNDAMPLLEQAPWLRPGEPKVVPGVLDGEHAVLLRLAAIVGIAFGFLAAIILMVTASMSISEVLDGRAVIPVDEEGFS